MFLTIISTSIGFIFYFISILIFSPFVYIAMQVFEYKKNQSSIDNIAEVFIDIIALSLCFLFSKNKRIISGIHHLLYSKNIDIFIYISIMILAFFALINPNVSDNNLIYLIPLFSIFIFSFTLFFLLKSKIMQIYIEKLKSKEVLDLQEELISLKEDNNALSKQIHKDNKILPVIQLSLIELCHEYDETDKIKDLQSQLDVLMKERYSIIQDMNKLSVSCEIPSTDAVFQYYFNKGKKENIKVEFEISENALSNCKIPINDINTLLCDLLENAMIAVRSEDEKNILLKIHSSNNILTISVFDNGQPFAKEVLEKLGKERITTHAETGGSGIGLITIFEILNKYNGSFSINNCSFKDIYTKEILINFS